MVERYRISHKLQVQHAFFGEAPCPIAIEPLPETQRAFLKYHLAWKRQGTNAWTLIAPERSPRNADILVDLRFRVKPTSTLFYQVTSPDAQLEGFDGTSLTPVAKDGIWSLLSFCFQPTDAVQALTLSFASGERHWEYLAFPRDLHDLESLIVTDESGMLAFNREGEVDFADGRTAVRFVSAVSVPLKAYYPYRVRLWKDDEGTPLLVRHLDHPSPTSNSIYHSNTITCYCNC